MEVLYKAHAVASGGGRDEGRSATDDGKIDVLLSVPTEMGGKGGAGTNPEQLFAVGYSACFLGALKAVGRGEKVRIPDEAAIDAAVSFGERADGPGFGIAVAMTVTLPGIEYDKAVELVAKAHQICPYSNATRGNIDVTFTVA